MRNGEIGGTLVGILFILPCSGVIESISKAFPIITMSTRAGRSMFRCVVARLIGCVTVQ